MVIVALSWTAALRLRYKVPAADLAAGQLSLGPVGFRCVATRLVLIRGYGNLIPIMFPNLKRTIMNQSIAYFRARAFEEQQGRCFYCGFSIWNEDAESFASSATQFRCTAEHLIARKDGGKNTRANIVAACHLCNKRRHASKRQHTWSASKSLKER